MSTPYDSYDQVPWFRKQWFAVVGCFVFMPAIVVMAFAGGFYYSKDGKAKAFPEWVKFALLGWLLLVIGSFVVQQKTAALREAQSSVLKPSQAEWNAMFEEAPHMPVAIQAPIPKPAPETETRTELTATPEPISTPEAAQAVTADDAAAPSVSVAPVSSSPTLCTGSKTVFACTTTKGKVVAVCDAGNTLQYRFGSPEETPEMTLSVPRAKASTLQWNGRESPMTYSVQIPNGNTVYEVFVSTDRVGDSHKSTSGINVTIAGKHRATLTCQGDTLRQDLEGILLKPAV